MNRCYELRSTIRFFPKFPKWDILGVSKNKGGPQIIWVPPNLLYHMGVSKNKGGKTPQIIPFNRVFHYFYHPFCGYPYFWRDSHMDSLGFPFRWPLGTSLHAIQTTLLWSNRRISVFFGREKTERVAGGGVKLVQNLLKTLVFIEFSSNKAVILDQKALHHDATRLKKKLAFTAINAFFIIPQMALAIGVLTSNRRGGWLPTLAGFTLGAIAWVPLLGAIVGCHCWMPLLGAIAWVPLLGAIVGCHCWMLATNFGGVHVRRHCWAPLLGAILLGCHCRVPLLGAIAGVPLLGAIVGCHCWGAIAGRHCSVKLLGCHCWGAIAGCHCWVPLLGCHCWVPLWSAMAGCHCWVPLPGAMLGCHCWVPLREKIDQSVTQFSAAPFSTLITHKLACAILCLCWYNSQLPFSMFGNV